MLSSNNNSSTTASKNIRERYELLGLIDLGVLSSSPLSSFAERVVNQIKNYGRLLLRLIVDQGKAIVRELSREREHELTAVVQVQMGFTPTVTIGIEQHGRICERSERLAAGNADCIGPLNTPPNGPWLMSCSGHCHATNTAIRS
jgi:hypothetical protein